MFVAETLRGYNLTELERDVNGAVSVSAATALRLDSRGPFVKFQYHHACLVHASMVQYVRRMAGTTPANAGQVSQSNALYSNLDHILFIHLDSCWFICLLEFYG